MGKRQPKAPAWQPYVVRDPYSLVGGRWLVVVVRTRDVGEAVSVEVGGGGSGTGVTALISGTAQIANCSRTFEEKEVADFKAKNPGKEWGQEMPLGQGDVNIPAIVDAMAHRTDIWWVLEQDLACPAVPARACGRSRVRPCPSPSCAWPTGAACCAGA